MINDIKTKLPSGKKGGKADDNEDSDFTSGDRTDPNMSAPGGDATNNQTNSLLGKLKSKMGSKNASNAGGKKKASPILIIVILGFGAVFLIDSEEPATEVAAPPASKKIVKVVPPPAETLPAEAPKTEEPTDSGTASTPDAPADPSTTPADPTATDPAATTAETPSETPSEAPVDPAATAPSTEPTPDANPVPEESSLSDLLPPEETPSAQPTAPPASVDSVDGDVATDDTTTTDKILNDLEKQVKKEQPREVKKEYVNPPDYEYRGRGLVYNCSGKHWACVDAPSYKTCEDNHSSVTFLRKTVECYPFNVYQTQKGCEAMQNRVVSSNAKTNFCKGN